MRNVNIGINQIRSSKTTSYTAGWASKRLEEGVTWFQKYGEAYNRRREGKLPEDAYFGTAGQV
jgi:hypothetical protein